MSAPTGVSHDEIRMARDRLKLRRELGEVIDKKQAEADTIKRIGAVKQAMDAAGERIINQLQGANNVDFGTIRVIVGQEMQAVAEAFAKAPAE